MPASAIDLPVPDDDVHYAGGDHTGKRAERQFEHVTYHGLVPSSKVLDVGCGIGRLAYKLAYYLDPEQGGSYTGFDISPDAITWLNENYASKLPHFQFDLVRAKHPRFNPKGRGDATGVRFPYEDGQFDFLVSLSVFQHLTLQQIEHYLREMRRVLVPGGKALITMVVIFPDDEELTAASKPFIPVGGGHYETRPGHPKSGHAYDDDLMRATIATCGLEIVDFTPGAWHHHLPSPEIPHAAPDTFILTPA